MRVFFTTLFICQIVAITSCQSYAQKRVVKQNTEEVVIPMDMSTYRPIVEIMIDGKGPYKFIFDTGSTTNVIDQSLQEIIQFKVLSEDSLGTPGSKNKLVSKRVMVPKINFSGTNIFKDVEMNIISLKQMLPVDGILGGFFVEDYLATMDYPGSKLILTTGELDKSDKDVIPFIQSSRTLNLYIDVDGHRVEAHLDTGNPNAITLPHSMMDKLTFKEKPKKGNPLRTPVATFKTWTAKLQGTIKIGRLTFTNPEVILAERWKYPNIGYGIIHNLRTTIDRKNSLIKFEQVDDKPIKEERKKRVTSQSNQSSTYVGEYDGNRKIFLNESGELSYQRAGMPISLKLIKIEKDLFEMKVPEGVFNPQETPKIYFIRDRNKNISSIQFIYEERKDGPFKKMKQ